MRQKASIYKYTEEIALIINVLKASFDTQTSNIEGYKS